MKKARGFTRAAAIWPLVAAALVGTAQPEVDPNDPRPKEFVVDYFRAYRRVL